MNLDVIQPGGFYEGWLLNGHPLDLGGGLDQVELLECLNWTADDHSSGGNALATRLNVVRSRGCAQHARLNVAGVSDWRCTALTAKSDLQLRSVLIYNIIECFRGGGGSI